MKERIIFLDIDGVLNYSAYFHSKKYLSERNPICKRNLFWVGLLCRLFKAKVVLTSSWRFAWDEYGEAHRYKEVDQDFRIKGINIISVTASGALILQNNYELDEEKLDTWCSRPAAKGLEDVRDRKFVLEFCRGTQIMDWIESHNYKGKYIILEDDYQDVEFYKDLAKRLVITSYYDKRGGFGFKHFLKALKMLM
jgi:hypothetical protein